MDKRVCVNIHSKRKRLADTDGCSVKAVFDALTKAGIWPDDSAKYIKEVSYTQEKSEVEETIITITREITTQTPETPRNREDGAAPVAETSLRMSKHRR